MDKRTFLKNFSILSLGVLPNIQALGKFVESYQHVSLDDLAEDEDFWAKVREGYRLNPDYINLENGYYCMMPEETLEHYIKHVRLINYEASHYMRTVQFENRNEIRKRLAELAGCSYDELVITRNTTESLDLVIGGLPWKSGHEAIVAEQDYGAMLNMFRLINERYGVITKRVSLPNHPESDKEIVKLYEDQITNNTKLIMISHLVNISGQVLPVKKICDMAHSHGVEVMVDGAHAFAHLDFKISDLNCDYYGTSLHKWLSAPLGCGFLYINKDKIEKLWPLFAEDVKPQDDIDRLNHLGTTPVHVDLGIANAIDFHKAIGAERKLKRLQFLKKYWTEKLKDHPKIEINTPWEEERHGAIANVLVKGMMASEISKILMDKYSIWTVAINRPNVHGIRVTPNLYTSLNELDQFVKALDEIAS
ncbi:MAG: aminotransferase class V-fold PLP-dependent enzyme [Crocinitomicaceae bacterium]|nr:aminotransferase class V-fold PLP-dependent enzyme [Crocinitomicaceae bacterium]